ncbi:MAG TPA: T9SS type A sorting domain-containing protein [Chitinophagales bacterium]|nr:T9SS type A sorting domain-containing protein [Chitinophagales bacterium]
MKKIFTITFFFILLGLCKNTFAADSTFFRLKSLQDTVDANDTVDVDLFIGDINNPAIDIKEFELEIEYDLDICDKNKIDFKLDTASLTAFFGTPFSDISTIDNMTGRVNIKVNCDAKGNGVARIGTIKYIIQDNLASRQLLKFDFFKLSSKRLNGGGDNKPVKMEKDSVWVIKGFRNQVTTAIRTNTKANVQIFPNPASNYLQISGKNIEQYKLINMLGKTEVAAVNTNKASNISVDISTISTGEYILMIYDENNWNSYKIIKE